MEDAIYNSFQPSWLRSALDLKWELLMHLAVDSSLFAAQKAGCHVWSLPFTSLGLLPCGCAELVGKHSTGLSQHLQKFGELQRWVDEMSCRLQALCKLPRHFCCAYMQCAMYVIHTCLQGGMIVNVTCTNFLVKWDFDEV